MNRIHTLAAACAITLAFAAQSQTPPPKSQARPPSIVIPPAASAPAKSAGPKTLSGKAASGKMLSREELRACLARLDAVNSSGKDLEARRAALDAEKGDIVKSGDTLKTELADVNAKLAQVREWETRSKSHGAAVEAYNAKLATADQVPKNEREAFKAATDAERDRLTKDRASLEADFNRLMPIYEAAAKGYNEKVKVRDSVVDGWNQRNQAVNDDAAKLSEERKAWLDECANRPYREDDEAAIKKGK